MATEWTDFSPKGTLKYFWILFATSIQIQQLKDILNSILNEHSPDAGTRVVKVEKRWKMRERWTERLIMRERDGGGCHLTNAVRPSAVLSLSTVSAHTCTNALLLSSSIILLLKPLSSITSSLPHPVGRSATSVASSFLIWPSTACLIPLSPARMRFLSFSRSDPNVQACIWACIYVPGSDSLSSLSPEAFSPSLMAVCPCYTGWHCIGRIYFPLINSLCVSKGFSLHLSSFPVVTLMFSGTIDADPLLGRTVLTRSSLLPQRWHGTACYYDNAVSGNYSHMQH